MRERNRSDGSLSGNTFKLLEDGKTPYRKVIARSKVYFQQSEEHDAQFNTRDDIRTLHQTSWADGSLWNIPLLSERSIQSYHLAEGIDAVEVPGELVPMPLWASFTTEEGNIPYGGTMVQLGEDLFFGGTLGLNGAFRKYDASAGTWGTTTQVSTTSDLQKTAYDQANDYLITINAAGNFWAMKSDDSADISVYALGVKPKVGAALFTHFGRVMYYDGNRLYEITTPYATPGNTTIFNDGGGNDWLEGRLSQTDPLFRPETLRLATSTTEGVYLVKNLSQAGTVVATIYRIERSNDGIDIGVPVATLPQGYVALDVQWHLGTLFLVASNELSKVVTNDPDVPYGTTVFFLERDNLGTVGTPLGYDAPDETVGQLLGVYGDSIYLGGAKRIWRYDAVRGGLHPIIYHNLDEMPVTMAQTNDQGSHELWFVTDTGNIVQQPLTGGTSNDSLTRSLTSNYFDLNIPAEEKTVTHVTLMTDGIQANETWAVQVSVDDGAFATIASFTSADAATTRKRFSTVKTGYRFRYKIVYTASGSVASPSRVKGIVFAGQQGILVWQWQLRIDGSTLYNLANKRQRPEDILTWLESVARDETVQTYIDQYRADPATYNVKVEQVGVEKNGPNTLVATVVLTEDA